MPPKKVSADAPVATRPSRSRAAKTSPVEAIAKTNSAKTAIKKIAATAKSTLRRLSPKPTTKSTASTSPTSTNAKSTASKKSAASNSNISTSTTAKKPTAARPIKKTVGAVAASKKKTVTKAAEKDTGKRANISKKRAHRNDEDDKENEPEVKKARSKTASKLKTTTAKAKKSAPNTASRSKTAPSAKAAAKSNAAPVKAELNKSSKRKASEESQDAPASKERKVAATKKVAAPKTPVDPIMKIKIKIGVQINFAPTDVLDVFVFGEGSAGELGLGARKVNGKSPIDVKRPRKNPLLSAPSVGVVQLACGGMHALALTKHNKILSWGVNDNGALGRNCEWSGGLRDADAPEAEGSDSDDSDDDSGLNPRESTPTEIDMSEVAPGTKFVQIAASDSASFALTEDGRVYGWGNFRGGDGNFGFTPTIDKAMKPMLLTDVTKIVAIATGSNHVLVLDHKGKVFTWGAPEQNQLGRRVVERDAKASALRAGGLTFKRGVRIVKIACGSYHSFALDSQGRVWSWGLNNFGQLGHSASADGDDACQLQPKMIDALADTRIVDVAGGEHLSIVVTDEGKALIFGRANNDALGIAPERLNEENALYDDNNKAAMLFVPTELLGLPKIVTADVGTATSYVVSEDGQVYSWGFNTNYQCGIGETEEEVMIPRRIDNSVVIDRKIVFAGAGGQFGMLAAVQEAS